MSNVSQDPHLPFESLSWEQFEAFAHALIARLPGFTNCHRYGAQGHAQGGIDIFADDAEGRRWAFSNKRYHLTAYRPHHVQKQVEETSYTASHCVILLSSIASSSVRDEIEKHADWELWDASDLSLKVRDLLAVDPNAARELVDHYFDSRWRRDFLGLPALAAFLTPRDYFSEYLNATKLFHHALALIGRARVLSELIEFGRTGDRRVALLPGRGGIGKSRLLRAVAEELEVSLPDLSIRFVVEGVPLSVDAFDELPNRACLVVVDDAHRYDGLELLAAAVRRQPHLKLLLATRPHGIDQIHGTLTRAGFDPREATELDPLGPLSLEDTRVLARAAIGTTADVGELAVERLARITRDCPLATVIGGKLLAENAIAPELLEQDESFRRAVFDKFQDERLGQLGPDIDPDSARRTLQVLAALNPLSVSQHDSVLAQISAFLDRDSIDLAQMIGEFERVGLLVRRGARLRLTPDVLADHILAKACLTPQNKSNGFSKRVFEHFRQICPEQVLRNLAELDWRVRATGTEETGLIDDLWSSLETAFQHGNQDTRGRIIDLVTAAACYQPRRALALAESVARALLPSRPDEIREEGTESECENLLERLPELLHRSAYSRATLPRCLELLWEVAGINEHCRDGAAGKAIEVILELAKYEHEKQVWVNEVVAHAIQSWSNTPTPAKRAVIFEALGLLLVKAGSDTWSTGNRICISSFYVCPTTVRGIRRVCMGVVERYLKSPDSAVQIQAIKLLHDALNGPMPHGNLPLTSELLAEWEPDQLGILDILSDYLTQGRAPVLQLRVFEAVKFQASHSSRSPVKARAREIVQLVDDSFETRLTRSLLTRLSRWDEFDDDDDDDERPDTIAVLAERHRRHLQRVASEIWEQYPDGSEAFAFLEMFTSQLLVVEREVAPNSVMWYMLEAKPSESIHFARRVVASIQSPLRLCIATCLVRAALVDQEAAARLIREVLTPATEPDFVPLRRECAHHYCWNWPEGRILSATDIENLRLLLADSDSAIREHGLKSLHHLAVTDSALARELALSVEFGDGPDVADEFARLMVPTQPGHLASLTQGDALAILPRLDAIKKLEYWTCKLLTELASPAPDAVLDLLLRRILIEEGAQFRMDYHPLPDRGMSTLGGIFAALDGNSQQPELVRRVRDRSLPRLRHSANSLSRLFRAVTGNYKAVGLCALNEWIDSGDVDRVIAALELLHDAGRGFVFAEAQFVRHALDAAYALSDDCGESAYRVFLKLAIYFGRSGFAGEIFPQDLEMREKATAARDAEAPGSRTYRLYEAIRRDAESNIQSQADRIEDDED